MKTIKILGTGCPSCIMLEKGVDLALEQSGIQAKVEKVTNIEDIISYGIMATPGLVIDEKVVSSGKVNTVEEIISFLQGNNDAKQENNSCGCTSCGCSA